MRAIVLVLSIVSIAANAQTPSVLWGSLSKGRFEVGYKSMYVFDYSRPALSNQVLDGKIVSTPDAPGRQMQISVWYPATKAGRKMTYADYISETMNELGVRSSKTPPEDPFEKFKYYHSNTTINSDEFGKILGLPMEASRDIKQASGKFPLLIFPHWFSPADGSIMSEYLASRGFVVASTSLKGSDSVLPEISVRGLKSLAADINFMINALSNQPFVDVTKVAVMGVGINATGAVTAMKDVSTIDAFVSLDGGIITESELQMFQMCDQVNLSQLAKPMLFAHAPHPAVRPELASYFKYSDKHYVKFSQMSEFHFLNNGMLESIVPGIIGKAPGDVKSGFEMSCRYVEAFLNHSLMNKDEGLTFLNNDPAKNGAIGVESWFNKGLPVPYSLHDLKAISATNGASGLRAAFEKFRPNDSTPFSQAVLADLYSWLAFTRDDDFEKRKEVLRIWLESYPSSSRGNYLMARIAAAQSNPTDAKKYYQKALDLLPFDNDLSLDGPIRQRIKTVSEEEVKKAG